MDLPKRKPARLKDFDYSSQGAYFVTICTKDKQKILCDIVGAIHESPEIQLSLNGMIVDKYINQLNTCFALNIDKYVIMPNHIHMVIFVGERSIRESTLRKRSIISNAVGYLKMNASRDIHKNGFNDTIWQRSSYNKVVVFSVPLQGQYATL